MNPLFPNFDRELQEAVRREFQATELGKLLSSGGPKEVRDVKKLARLVKKYVRGGTPTKYGKGVRGILSSLIQQQIDQQLAKLPMGLGSVISSMMRPTGESLVQSLDRELKAAANLLQAFGYGVTSTEKVEESPGVPARPEWMRGREQGQTPGVRPFVPIPRPEPVAEPPKTLPPMATGSRQARQWQTVRVNGQTLRIEQGDPMLTGEMIRVTSSNVHSIGFIWNTENPRSGTLKVRFLNRTKSGGGPLYHYYNVNPLVFRAFQAASSKGKFVWDRLRVRGTVSGHQFQYRLAGLDSSGYVPRQATRLGPNEYFLPREVRSTAGRVYRSELQAEFVQRVGNFRPPPGVVAGRGAPNRGGPNRGRPGNGRP